MQISASARAVFGVSCDGGWGAVEQQGHGRVAAQPGGIVGVVVRGHGQGRYGVLALGRQPEPFPAGGEHLQPGSRAQQLGELVGQVGVEQVLTVVEDDQPVRRTVAVRPRGPGQLGPHLPGVADGREVHPAHVVAVRADRKSEPGLANPRRAGERHQPGAPEQVEDVLDLRSPPDQRSGRSGR